MNTQELKKRMYPVKERFINSFGYLESENYNYAMNIYNDICSGNQEVINYWLDFFAKEEKKAEEKLNRVKSFNKNVQDNLTTIALEIGVTKKLLVEVLKKDQKLYNAVRFKGFNDLEVIKSKF